LNTNIVSGIGFREEGSPRERGRLAAGIAAGNAGLAPALALVVNADGEGTEEVLGGIREVLGDCPLIGCNAEPSTISTSFPAPGLPGTGVGVFLIASGYLDVKIATGFDQGGDWQREIAEAFEQSYIGGLGKTMGRNPSDKDLCSWYLYRPPSLALSIIISKPEEKLARERGVSHFLRDRFHGRVPFMTFSCASERPEVFAGGRIVSEGIVLAIMKTDLKFSMNRFHNFEPMQKKFFVTRSEDTRVFEVNARPALSGYLSFSGDTVQMEERNIRGYFSLYPLAYRGKEGKYHLFLPETVNEDQSLVLPFKPHPRKPFFPMISVSASDVAPGGEAAARKGSGQKAKDCTLLLRNRELRDHDLFAPDPHGSGGREGETIRVGFNRDLKAYLPDDYLHGETSHLALTFHEALDPIAVAAFENGRLLKEVIRLKQLNQQVFEGIGDGVALLDPQLRLIHVNRKYCEIIGMSEEELIGEPCPWRGDVCGCVASEALREKSDMFNEMTRLGDDGLVWLRIECFPVTDGEGNVTAVVEVLRDVSKFKNLQMSLESEKRKLEAVVDGMAESIYIVDRNHNLQLAHAGEHFASMEDNANPLGEKCYELIFQRELPCPWCGLDSIFESGGIVRKLAHIDDESGGERYCQVTFSPWSDDQGRVSAGICLVVDITAQRKMEQQMIHTERLGSLSVLSAGMAHELNNPLGAINFNIEVLSRRESNPEYQELLTSIKKDTERINRIVGNLLSFSRRSAHSFGPVDPAEVLNAALELFPGALGKRKIEIVKSIPPDIAHLWGNFQDLQQVFVNLVSNAIDAMPAGGRITVRAELKEGGSGREAKTQIVVLYNRDVELLRSLTQEPGWEARFLRNEEEALDYFRQPDFVSPDIFLLDYGNIDEARIRRLLSAVGDASPSTRVIFLDGMKDQTSQSDLFDHSGDRRLGDTVSREDLVFDIRSMLPKRRPKVVEPPHVEILFSDTGVGISVGQKQRIFDPFFTTKDESKGTGLGLSVVHKILENHGAKISVESRPGEGTTFRIVFPRRREGDPVESGGAYLREGMVWES